MNKKRIPQRGDVYWINPNPTAGKEMKNMHPFVVVTLAEINRFGISVLVPITTHGNFSRIKGLAIPVVGQRVSGVAVCNQPRSFDIEARIKEGTAKYIETIDRQLANDIANRTADIIGPEILN